MQIQNAAVTGSFSYNGVDISSITSSTSNISALNAITASLLSTTASLNTASGSAITRLNSIESTTGSLNTASGSAITRLNAIEVVTGSNISRLNSIELTTGSLNTASGSAITRLNAIEVVTGSNISRLSSLEARTGSYATTGSNIFVGSQTITGSILGSGSLSINGCIVSTGQIVAQTINVQQVTSSVVYSCGSNIFGCAVTDTQQMTGSLRVTGSLNVVGQACASIISAKQGTTSYSLIVDNCYGLSDQNYVSLEANGTRIGAITRPAGTNDLQVSALYGNLIFGSNTGGNITERARITTSGIACFSNNVCALNLASKCNIRVGIDGGYSIISGPTTGAAISLGANSATFDRNLSLGLISADLATFSPVLTINAQTGNVGIGNCTPDRRFYVADTSATQSTILGYNQCTCFTGTVIEAITDRTSSSAFNLMNLKASTTSMLLVRGDGIVGIGTASPTQVLTVNGNVAVGGQQAFWLRDDDGFSSNAGRRAWAIAANYISFGTLSFFSSATCNTNPLGSCNPFNITSCGNVGIQTTSPGLPLHVTSPGGLQLRLSDQGGANYYDLGRENSVTGNFEIRRNGNAGIMMTSTGITCFACQVCTPRLHINTPDGCGLTLQYGANSGYAGVSTDSANSLIFKAYIGTEYMRIKCDGSVGIGTISPGAPLHICWGSSSNTNPTLIIEGAVANNSNYPRVRFKGGTYPDADSKYPLLYITNGGLGLYLNGGYSATYNNPTALGLNNGTITLETGNAGSLNTRLAVDNTGIACFSCQICVGGMVALTNTSFGGPATEAAYRIRMYDNGGINNDPGIGLDGSGGGGEKMWFNSLGGFYMNLGTNGAKFSMNSGGDVCFGSTVNNLSGTAYSNNVVTYSVGGFMIGQTASSWDFPTWNDSNQGQIFEIKAFFEHYLNWGYGTSLYKYMATRSTGGQDLTMFNCVTGNGGCWIAYKTSDTNLRVCKIAGSYAGGGAYWIQVIAKQP